MADEIKHEASFKQFEQVTMISLGQGINLRNRLEVSLLSAAKRFEALLGKAFNELVEYNRNMFNLEAEDNTTLATKYEKFPDIAYKNPYGFILGYITACKYSKATYMGVKKMLEQYRKVPILIENGIEDADIVRYTRYWLRYYYNISDINNMNLVPREHEPIIREADNRDELRRQFLRRDTYGDEDEEEF